MWQSILLSFFGGLFGANGVPHFVKGITKENYPCLAGNTPIPNLIAGLIMFILSIVLFHFADIRGTPLTCLITAAFGALVIGLVHAGPGAFGRKEDL
ncbi:hypothetical protein SAMN05192574_102138 [Mucilaginibacter gossypiicola]|uniref:Uncharacterized protein n=1 Tax=Mucilaginibacter gossypiicola TaxID=551995 RepID=A0A1H8CYS4_9SPHI|nr:hypothetical protein [Mucilaginibacter gossypiicola]SEN00243.1 hypothetical protein SAMN05192574_102138 [Mucilaginibacter gossypiicola]